MFYTISYPETASSLELNLFGDLNTGGKIHLLQLEISKLAKEQVFVFNQEKLDHLLHYWAFSKDFIIG